MANRPVFIPKETYPFVIEKSLEFEWFPGFSKSQAQKSIRSLHLAGHNAGIKPILEISSKSPFTVGVQLSAFNLMINFAQDIVMSVECAFQGSKVFWGGGPYQDLYERTSMEAKRDFRLSNSGEILEFRLFDEDFPTNPKTLFYDWLYLKALNQNPILSSKLVNYQGFTDIAFNPKKSINCQARSAALFVSLTNNGKIDEVLKVKEYYFRLMRVSNNEKGNNAENDYLQSSLFEERKN